jgi:hypothetical protein
MKFALEDISEDQFEALVVRLCHELFGISVQGFAKGPDGGRDAKFCGTAQIFPSTASPWAGTTIIQAKHTNGFNKSCSESDFFSVTAKPESTVIGKEIPRIIALKKSGELTHYMLFTNRSLTGLAEPKIKKHISDSCEIPVDSIHLCDSKQIELYLERYPHIPRLAKLDPLESPLIVSSDELAEVIEAFSEQVQLIAGQERPPVDRLANYERKNQINNMSGEFALALRKAFLKETQQVKEFLANPANIHLCDMYTSVTEEFKLKIIAHKSEYQTFDLVFNYIFDLLINRSAILKSHKKLTRQMLFYMYWNCDIGMNEEIEAVV